MRDLRGQLRLHVNFMRINEFAILSTINLYVHKFAYLHDCEFSMKNLK